MIERSFRTSSPAWICGSTDRSVVPFGIGNGEPGDSAQLVTGPTGAPREPAFSHTRPDLKIDHRVEGAQSITLERGSLFNFIFIQEVPSSIFFKLTKDKCLMSIHPALTQGTILCGLIRAPQAPYPERSVIRLEVPRW